MTEPLLFTVADQIATLTLNRPERRNAFNDEMIDRWAAALEECHQRPDIRVVVVTGAGRAFCSGGDIEEMQRRLAEGNPLSQKRFIDRVQRIALTLATMDKPVIAAINGAATGAGLDMALMCDLRFAADNARLAETYVKVGLVPGDGGAYFLPRLVGVAKALELLWTGDFIDIHEAERLGLVNRVLPAEELMPYTFEFARRLARGPAVAIQLTKRLVYEGLRSDNLRANLDIASSHLAVAALTRDHREAVQAFLEKRPPEFEGR
jgi:2-(1,2-epoxy-1,2-dihydrophenyl)acetyl-CoA isomerase